MPVCSLAQPDVAEDQIDLLALEHLERFVEVVDRRDDLVTGVAEHIFIVERGQRLILDDEDPLDDLLALPEQHRHSDMTSPPQRTKRRPVPQPAQSRRALCLRQPQDARTGRSASPSCSRAPESPRAAKSSG